MDRRFPQILAPAGNRASFLAALAAGADAIYVGLKHYSARMAADNFSLSELTAMKELAARRNVALYVAMNTMVKPAEPEPAGRLIDRLTRHVAPDALIIQDPGLLELARQAGFAGELHLSTLANVSHPAALTWARERLNVDRVILPRELDIDEIKACAAACPPGLSLEVFVHGALCYAVSGRCWWSSYMGGKSGLRGRCVQPCRRRYDLRGGAGGRRGGSPKRTRPVRGRGKAGNAAKGGARAFSCQDLSLDVLTRPLAEIPEVVSWKIEGRKKGPHYVYHVVSAYRLLRDEGGDSAARKQAQDYLEQALGRPGSHYRFLPQRIHAPVSAAGETASGLLVGRVSVDTEGKKVSLRPRFPLKRGDLLRVGYEDEPWHRTLPITRAVPKGGTLTLPPAKAKRPVPGAEVFLIDRREPELAAILTELGRELEAIPAPPAKASEFTPHLPPPATKRPKPTTVQLFRRLPQGRLQGRPGLWLRPGILREVARSFVPKVWWWMPPVIWPDEEVQWMALMNDLLRSGARHVVLGAPWQLALIENARERLDVWAGPFCNLANPAALALLARLGVGGAFVSPELSRDDMLTLARTSPLPLGVVIEGLWPLCVSRTLAKEVKPNAPFVSPMGEAAFARRHGQNVWLYPGWPMSLAEQRSELEQAGYTVFATLHEPLPQKARSDRDPSRFNWELTLY